MQILLVQKRRAPDQGLSMVALGELPDVQRIHGITPQPSSRQLHRRLSEVLRPRGVTGACRAQEGSDSGSSLRRMAMATW